ncbi:MAG: hypothetical protein PUB13_01735, partial [Lachnospiraceae bacterium]|nr:hypothetical protein [Lachnospiraceae bacterium]
MGIFILANPRNRVGFFYCKKERGKKMTLGELKKVLFVDVTIYEVPERSYVLKKVFKGDYFDIPEE